MPRSVSLAAGLALFATVTLLDSAPSLAERKTIYFRKIDNGVDYAAVTVPSTSEMGDHKLHILRVDPAVARLVAGLASERGRSARTAGEWCHELGLSAAINIGMYRDDQLTNVGYLRNGDHVQNPRWVGKYQSALALDPAKSNLPSSTLLDLDHPGARAQLESYPTVIQNLRLIKDNGGKGASTWGPQSRRWSEAAIALDDKGRVLFVFSRTPFSMSEFNQRLLALDLGVIRAMHAEGGPEASLSIHGGGIDLDFNGSFETGFVEHDGWAEQYPIPNVIGVRKSP